MCEIPTWERDPRLTRLDTSVLDAGEDDGPFVVLRDVLLYPEGGGQPADRGRIADVEVVDVQRVSGEVRHYLARPGPQPGQTVSVELDWDRRFDHMQQHTGQHLLTAVAETRFGWATTAFHLGSALCDIELDTSAVDASRLAELEEAVAEEIRACRPVTTRRVGHAEYLEMPVRSRGLPAGHGGTVRLVEIEGVDLNTCGGTHCSSTAEVEALKLLGTETVRGGTRLFYAAGGRLRRLLAGHHARSAELRAMLGAADSDLPGAVRSKLEQLKDAHREIRGLEEDLATACAEALAARSERLLDAHWPKRTLPFLQKVARQLQRSAPDRVVFLTCGEGGEGAFLVAAGSNAGTDVSVVGEEVAAVLDGRGGGSGGVYQGRATGVEKRDEAVEVLRRAV